MYLRAVKTPASTRRQNKINKPPFNLLPTHIYIYRVYYVCCHSNKFEVWCLSVCRLSLTIPLANVILSNL